MDRLPARTVEESVARARDEGVDRDVRWLLRWAHELLGPRLMMSTAFGKSGMVILHMLRDEAPEVPVYFVDTGFHFPETLRFVETLRERWSLSVIPQRPKLYGDDFIAQHGEKPYERDPDFCCHKNKVEPFRELFGAEGRHQGWITGVRRDQSSSRAAAEPVEILDGGLLKVQPLAFWTLQDVEEYIAKHDIPLHPLFAAGYTSIGCAPCTRKNRDRTNERAGRWAGKAKTECGLHTFWKKKTPKPATAGPPEAPSATPPAAENGAEPPRADDGATRRVEKHPSPIPPPERKGPREAPSSAARASR